MKKIIIAIDGHSGCGKSTLARQLAEKLQYLYIDSGAMYRAITLYFLEQNINLNKEYIPFQEIFENIQLEFLRDGKSNHSKITLNGRVVEQEIRGMEVANRVSEIAAIPEVRQFAVSKQQLLGKEKGVVMDGRDIGTVVFPNAELKIFLTASTEVRVERRYKELQEKGSSVTKSEVQKNLLERDYKDTHRKESPLRQAEDAVVIDNSQLSRLEQLEKALKLAEEKLS